MALKAIVLLPDRSPFPAALSNAQTVWCMSAFRSEVGVPSRRIRPNIGATVMSRYFSIHPSREGPGQS